MEEKLAWRLLPLSDIPERIKPHQAREWLVYGTQKEYEGALISIIKSNDGIISMSFRNPNGFFTFCESHYEEDGTLKDPSNLDSWIRYSNELTELPLHIRELLVSSWVPEVRKEVKDRYDTKLETRVELAKLDRQRDPINYIDSTKLQFR